MPGSTEWDLADLAPPEAFHAKQHLSSSDARSLQLKRERQELKGEPCGSPHFDWPLSLHCELVREVLKAARRLLDGLRSSTAEERLELDQRENQCGF